jgi:integration host factor subunit alpha
MTKADIAEKIYTNTNYGFTKREAADLAETVFDILKDALETDGKVKISGFGNFEVKQKADRRGRNPQTGDAITITARRVLTFKPSGVLKRDLNDKRTTLGSAAD